MKAIVRLSLGSLMAISVSQGQPIAVVNSGFEQPGTGQKFFDPIGNPAPNVPGWTASGVGVEGGSGDSGLEAGGDVSSPGWQAYLAGLDPSIYQTTSTAS